MKTLIKKRKRAVSKPNHVPSQTEALVKARLFLNTDAAQRQAQYVWFAVDPELRLQAAIELFRSDEVTMERAAEIAGLNRWVFQETLIKRKIKTVLEVDPVEELKKATAAIRRHAQ